MNLKNEYLPYPAIIESIREETQDTKTFKVRFRDEKIRDSFIYKQGQFLEVSVPGYGEAPISITSSPSRKGFLELTIRACGKVTGAIHGLKERDEIYLRGPYGSAFPFSELSGKNLYFVAGGIGLAPLRSLVNLVMDNRKKFGRIKILYGARTEADMCFTEDLAEWKKAADTEVWLTVDNPSKGWTGCVGVVTELWNYTSVSPENSASVVCGPPVMIKFVTLKLSESGFPDSSIIVTLERYMKCGIGKCGHCNIGEKFVCMDGPVFDYSQVKKFPPKENAI